MAGIRMPKTLKNFNLFVEGEGYQGRVTECQLPNVEVNTDEHRAGGMDHPRKMDMGLSSLECSFKLAEFNATVHGLVGLHNGHETQIIIRGALNDDQSTTAVSVIATIRGAIQKGENSAFKAGEKTDNTYTVDCKYYRLEVDGAQVYEIDNDNLKRVINGTDQIESIRSAIGM